MTLRLGIERPNRPLEVVADAEARVITHELERRLGDVTIDFRVDGPAIGPWSPSELASWPGAIDHHLDAGVLWADGARPLTALFARTVDPAAADVRERMLSHLGVLPLDRFDDDTVSRWTQIGAVRPTDLWLVVTRAEIVDVTDPSVAAFDTRAGAATDLDRAFDAVAAELDASPSSPERLEHAIAAAAAANARAEAATDAALRIEREAVERCDELRDEIRSLRDQLERAELSRHLDATADPARS